MGVQRLLGLLALFDYTFRVRARLHRFLLIVLMLALPVQAFAYSGMQACLFSEQGAAEPMAMSDDATSMAGCHQTSSSQHQGLPAQHECKFCAACALASALPIELVGSPPVVPITHSFAPHSAASFSAFIPDGPERPPRTPLA